ncbi:MAG TPA: DUF1254 domain-containing protein [Gemmatimonadaceae bacterium]
MKAQPVPVRTTSAAEAGKVAADAYIFGYPLVLMDATRAVQTAVTKPEGLHAPTNMFAHLRAFPDATFTDVVRPNADTLYSVAWLDLTNEPMVLALPDMGRRFYLMQLLDAWTNVVAGPGTRTTGPAKTTVAIVGPEWHGKLPAELTEIRVPTNMAWLIGRTQTNGASDYAAVHEIQDQYVLTPLSAFGSAAAPAERPVDASVDTVTPPADQVARMDAAAFFGRMNALMKANPPLPADARAMERFATLGIRPGAPIDAATAPPALAAGASAGRTRMMEQSKGPLGAVVNGWEFLAQGVGRFGTNYLLRAVVALVGLGANLPDDAVYPLAVADGEGRPLHGAHKYRITFAKGALPPVNAFWSLTMYSARQTFVANPIGRYAIGDRDNLTTGADESLTLYIQHSSPGREHETNWLPAPSDAFTLVLRLYWPSKSILDGSWKPPAIQRLA